MRRTLIILFLLLMLCTFFLTVYVLIAHAEKITLEWDSVENVGGYYIYQTIHDYQGYEDKIGTRVFDFENPVKTEAYPDGKIPQNITTLTVDLPGIPGEDTKYAFTAKSFRGDSLSVQSNEVEFVVVLVPPIAPSQLQGSFNKDDGLISISWNQPADETWRSVSHWIVYSRESGTEQWNAVGRINSDHELTIEMPISAIMTGDRATLEFVIVAYRRSGVYSQNSDILSIDVDRTDVPPIQNLRINIEIPVI